MKRVYEKRFTKIGLCIGLLAGAFWGSRIGIATGGWAIAGTLPVGIISGIIMGLRGNKLGTELDRRGD